MDPQENTRIDLTQLLNGGPPKDGIPSIDRHRQVHAQWQRIQRWFRRSSVQEKGNLMDKMVLKEMCTRVRMAVTELPDAQKQVLELIIQLNLPQ